MMPSIVDVAGLNKISRTIFRNAILAIAGMVGLADQLPEEQEDPKPLIDGPSDGSVGSSPHP